MDAFQIGRLQLAFVSIPSTIPRVMGTTKMMIRVWAIGMLLLAGCDKSASNTEPTKSAESKPPATKPAKPTTQELLSSPYKRLRLPNTPLSMMAPESWKIDAVGPVTFVTGPSNFGTATIAVGSPGSIAFKQSEIDSLAGKLQSEIAAKPEEFRLGERRTAGKVQIIEKRFLGKPVTRDKRDEKGEPIPDDKNGFVTYTTTPVQWTLTLFVPAEQSYLRYELNFIDLDADQMAVDETLLNTIMGSVNVDSSARNATTTP